MKKIIIFSLILLFFHKTQNVFGAPGAFVVDNIEVIGELDGRSNRDRYLGAAFKKGFQKLIISIIRKKDQNELLSTDLKTISTFVSSYKIIEEKIEDNNYIIKFLLYIFLWFRWICTCLRSFSRKCCWEKGCAINKKFNLFNWKIFSYHNFFLFNYISNF